MMEIDRCELPCALVVRSRVRRGVTAHDLTATVPFGFRGLSNERRSQSLGMPKRALGGAHSGRSVER